MREVGISEIANLLNIYHSSKSLSYLLKQVSIKKSRPRIRTMQPDEGKAYGRNYPFNAPKREIDNTQRDMRYVYIEDGRQFHNCLPSRDFLDFGLPSQANGDPTQPQTYNYFITIT